MKQRCFFPTLLAILILFVHVNAYAWPASSQWIPMYKNSALLQDPSGDATGTRNVVSDPTHDAAFVFNDGSYLYFRLRLDQNPAGQGGQGLLQAFGWGVEIDTNRNAGDYEWIIMIDGISQIETVQLWQNTIQGTLGDPGDKAEILNSSFPLSSNYQITAADTAINGNADYFLDWRFPFTNFKQATGLSDSSPIRMFFGSSPSTNNLTDKGGDLVGESDLYAGFSDTITPLGTGPATGLVKFVTDVAGNGSVVQIYAGDTIYIRVNDSDLNYDNATLQTTVVTLNATSGDKMVVTLTETQANSGIFTASTPSQSASPVSGDGILQVKPGDTVSVEYVDAIDASLGINQIRANSLLVVSLLPSISLTKSVDQVSALPGEEITYTIYYKNAGVGAASDIIISDTIPLETTYMVGSLKIGNGTSNYATATALTDMADADAGTIIENNVIFTINSVTADDGIANSGGDEGKVFFKVIIK